MIATKVLPQRSRDAKRAEIAYLDGLLAGLEADLSSGAFQAACESLIDNDPRFVDRDPFDVWMMWMITTGRMEPT